MNFDELISLWTKAFNWLYKKDMALFETDVQERAIAGRLAMYLQQEYDPHFEKTACIDLEYNLSLIHISDPRDGLLSRMPSSA